MIKLIKNAGLEEIAKRCNYNLRSIRQYFKRECDVKNISKLTRIMKIFEEYLKTRKTKLRAELYIAEVLERIKE